MCAASRSDPGAGFRDAFQGRRCLVVTDGFFEWDAAKAPFWFHRADKKLVLLAGLFQPPGSDAPAVRAPPRPRFTILTTLPNRVVAPVHDRMPVIVAAGGNRRVAHRGTRRGGVPHPVRPR